MGRNIVIVFIFNLEITIQHQSMILAGNHVEENCKKDLARNLMAMCVIFYNPILNFWGGSRSLQPSTRSFV